MAYWWEAEDRRSYDVVRNELGQFSIWLQQRDVPSGWNRLGMTGTKEECLKFIDEVWTDLTPEGIGASGPPPTDTTSGALR